MRLRRTLSARRRRRRRWFLWLVPMAGSDGLFLWVPLAMLACNACLRCLLAMLACNASSQCLLAFAVSGPRAGFICVHRCRTYMRMNLLSWQNMNAICNWFDWMLCGGHLRWRSSRQQTPPTATKHYQAYSSACDAPPVHDSLKKHRCDRGTVVSTYGVKMH